VPCSCSASADRLDIFDEKAARRALRRYLNDGLGGYDALQIAAWAEEDGLEGASVVEVGGGIGQIQADLIRRGAAAGRVVELVAEYEAPADELARKAGVADRSSFSLADLLADPDAVEPADIVVLRRVVCCTPDGPELLGAAAGKARRALLASYPRDTPLVRLAFRLENLGMALFRKRFRSFVHPPTALERAVTARGFSRSRVARGLVWETAQFVPDGASSGPAPS
jgi:magnesium-protoporphyrin O-methyltransferase